MLNAVGTKPEKVMYLRHILVNGFDLTTDLKPLTG